MSFLYLAKTGIAHRWEFSMVPSMAHRWTMAKKSADHRWVIDGNAMVHRWPMDGLPWDPNSGNTLFQDRIYHNGQKSTIIKNTIHSVRAAETQYKDTFHPTMTIFTRFHNQNASTC